MTDVKYIPRLKLIYKNEIVPTLIKDMNISNIMLAPKIEKIVLNMGLGDAKLNKNGLNTAVGDEGGFSPNLNNTEDAIQLIVEAIE